MNRYGWIAACSLCLSATSPSFATDMPHKADGLTFIPLSDSADIDHDRLHRKTFIPLGGGPVFRRLHTSDFRAAPAAAPKPVAARPSPVTARDTGTGMTETERAKQLLSIFGAAD